MADLRRAISVAVTTGVVISATILGTAGFTVGPGCSLAQAVEAANTDALVVSCSAGSGSDLISLGAGTSRCTRSTSGCCASPTAPSPEVAPPLPEVAPPL